MNCGEKLTTKQAQEFMDKLKRIKKPDIDKCANIILLLAEAICGKKNIDYSKCINTIKK